MRKFAVLAAALLMLGAVGLAQMEPKPLAAPNTEFYIGYAYQYTNPDEPEVGNTHLNGVAFETSHYFKKWDLGVTVDLAHQANSHVDQTGIKYSRTSFMIGPTYRIHRIGFWTANVHALVGADNSTFTLPETSTTYSFKDSALAVMAGATVDGNLSRHLGIRLAQVDYVITDHYSSIQSGLRYTGGIVIRF